jgi:IS5 family transposase
MLHGMDRAVSGDTGYRGVAKRSSSAGKMVDWRTAMHLSVSKTLKKNSTGRTKGML